MMNRLVVVAAVMMAGCLAQKKEPAAAQDPLPPGYVVLATFTGEADLRAGTLTIRTAPPAGAIPGGVDAITALDGSVGVTNDGPIWLDKLNGCSAGVNSWGANVKVTSNVALQLSGVYAEVTEISSSGSAGCNSASSAPTDLKKDRGLWSYGSIVNGTPVSKTWEFTRQNATLVTFSGRIVGATVGVFNPTPNANGNVIAYNASGSNLVYAVGVVGGVIGSIAFIDSSGTVTNPAPVLHAVPYSLAPDPASGRIWFATWDSGLSPANGYVGYFDVAGSLMVEKNIKDDVGAAPSITAIVADPTDGTGATAWFVSRNWGGTANGLWKATGSGSLNVTAYYVEGPGTDLAFGSDNLIYLAQYGLHQIQVFNPATGESVATVPLAGECQRPKYIRRGPTGSQELWFIADDVITPIVNICKITETGSPRSVSVVASNTSARGLCVGPDGYVWYNVPDGGTSSGGNVVRLAGTPATHWSFDVGSGSVNASRYIACGGGAVWSSNFTRIARVVP